ncbi:MAG: alpha/beta hydrolase, partial [Acidimicrobiales bacterium]
TGDGPAVVLVHGITSSRDDWGPVADLLVDQGYTVVGVDQRGHGDSTVGGDGFGADRLGADLEEVLRELDLKDVTLVGHSMGGIAAMSYAIDHAASFSERVSGLVLVATIARTSRAYQRFGLRLLDDLLPLASNDIAIGRPVSAYSLFGKFGSTKLVAAAKASALRADREAIESCAIALGSYDISKRLGDIALPVRLIYGNRDIVTPIFENRRIVNGIDRAVSREVPGAGHLLIWTHPQDVCEEIQLA